MVLPGLLHAPEEPVRARLPRNLGPCRIVLGIAPTKAALLPGGSGANACLGGRAMSGWVEIITGPERKPSLSHSSPTEYAEDP